MKCLSWTILLFYVVLTYYIYNRLTPIKKDSLPLYRIRFAHSVLRTLCPMRWYARFTSSEDMITQIAQ